MDKANFNPRPPRGGRPSKTAKREFAEKIFQSTPPARGATLISRTVIQTIAFQSTPPARGATITSRESGKQWTISIHAPREGGDHPHDNDSKQNIISIHAPREGGDYYEPTDRKNELLFQSTPPARGATGLVLFRPRKNRHFNPRPPRGGRHTVKKIVDGFRISIHAPREGGDFEKGR